MFNNTIQISRGNIKAKQKLAIGQLFYDYPTKSVFLGTDEDSGDYKRVGGFDSLVMKGFLPTTVTTLDGLKNYIKDNIQKIPGKDYTKETLDLLPGDTYILTSSFTDTKWKSGDIIIYSGDLATEIADSLTAATANNILSNGWIYINCGLTDAARVEYNPENTKDSKIHKLFEQHSALPFQSVQHVLEFLVGGTLFYEGECDNIANISTTNGVFQFYKGPTVEEYEDPKTHNKIKLQTNSLVFLQNGVYYYIPLGVDNSKSIDGSFTNKTRDKDLDLSETTQKILSVDKNGGTVELKKSTDVKTIQQAIDYLHEAKADLDTAGKIPLSQIPNTLIGGLQFKGVITIGTDTNKDEYTSAEFAQIIKTKFHTGNEEVSSGEYVVLSGSEASLEADEDFTGSKIKIDGTEYNSGDWAIYKNDSFMKMEGSAAVDNINGLKAAVTIVGDEHEIKLDVGRDVISNVFTKIDVDNTTHSIKISTPNAIQTLDGFSQFSIPMGTGDKALQESEIKIAAHSKHNNTTFVGKNKNNKSVELEFPDKSGKILTTESGTNGSKDRIAKFNDDGKLTNSFLNEKIENNSIQTEFIDENDKTGLTYHHNERIFEISDNPFKPSSVSFYQFESNVYEDIKNNKQTLTNPARILSDCSVIDCGEWL